MPAPMSPVALKSNFSRLGIRCVLCLVCFFVGCTFTLSFMSTLECDRFNTSQKSSSPKFEELNEKTKKTTLLAIILSAPDNVIQRHALRRTWLSLADQELFKFYFVVGSKGIVGQNEDLLLTEEKQYSDLLILPNVEDNYNLLTIKLLASFVRINKHSDFDFVLKVDDDSYVDIRLLLRELSRREEKKRLYWGYFNGRAQIKQKGKWKETNWNMCDRYVPYARGGGYLLSRQLVCYIAENAEILNVYKNEDVSVGMWLAPLNVTHFHDVRFDTEWASRGCSNQHIITHPHDVAEIYKLHETLANNGHMCEVEFQKRPAYNYDWSVLPSECCNSLSL